MPYVKQELRNLLNPLIDQLMAGTPGEANYILTRFLLNYMKGRQKVDYALLNEIMGILESVKQEFNRRVVVPYEDKKKEENGDVYL